MEFFQCIKYLAMKSLRQDHLFLEYVAHLFVFSSSQFMTKIISYHGTQNLLLYMSSTCVSRALLQVQITQLFHPSRNCTKVDTEIHLKHQKNSDVSNKIN